jgi:transposase-like protein
MDSSYRPGQSQHMSSAPFDHLTTQEEAIAYLEQVRWNGKPACPKCQSERIGRHSSNDRQLSRWQCHDCRHTFSATAGTVLCGSRVPLLVWLRILQLVMDSKTRLNACEISRNLGVRRVTVWRIVHQIRTVMKHDPVQAAFFRRVAGLDDDPAPSP